MFFTLSVSVALVCVKYTNGFMIELEKASTNSEDLTSSPPQDSPQPISKLHVEKGSQQATKTMTALNASFKNFH